MALFCAAQHSEAAHDLAEAISDLAPEAAIIGACAADGVIGAGREHQGGPALGLLAATLPAGARVTPFHAQVGEGLRRPRTRRPPGRAGRIARSRARRSSLDAGRATHRGSWRGATAGRLRGARGAMARRACSRTAAVPRRASSASSWKVCRCRPSSRRARGRSALTSWITAAEGNLILELAGRPGARARAASSSRTCR